MTTVSIAMATYNGARYITEQLESFTRQTALPSELVITDDGSTDDTLAIIDAFAVRARFPVRVERNAKRLGHRANFMKAAGLCKSELIAFSDQDDVWLPEKLETCLAAFTDHDTLLAYHNLSFVSGELKELGTFDRLAAPRAINPANSIEPCGYSAGMTLVIRSQLLKFSDYWPETSDMFNANEREAHDQWFFFLASCMGSIAYIAKPMVLYRQHGRNTAVWVFPTILDNLKSTDLSSFRSREISAGKRALILEQLQTKVDEPARSRIKIAANGYRKFERSYRLRQKTYLSQNIFSRLRQLIASLRAGVYLPRTRWGSGRKAFVRDIVHAVIFPVQGCQ